MRALVTGASGFVGGVIARGLHHKGFEVQGWDRRPPMTTPAGEGFASKMVDLATDDIAALIEHCAPDVVVHAAGPASVAASFSNPVSDCGDTTVPWHRLLDGIRQAGARPLVIPISSAAVYGEPDRQPVAESCPLRPVSPYGYHRRMSELLAEEYAGVFGIDIAICRLFSTFGSSQRRLLVWELFTQALSNCKAIVLQGTGEETRDYLYEDDLARVTALLAHHHPRGLTTWNVATGRGVATRELAELVAAAAGKAKSIECRGMIRRGEPRHWTADVGRLQTLLAGERMTTLEDGLGHCARIWAKEQYGGGG
jgi:UDP-glucose 4-epimerase